MYKRHVRALLLCTLLSAGSVRAINIPTSVTGIPGVGNVLDFLAQFEGLSQVNEYLDTACKTVGKIPDFNWVCNIRNITKYVDDLVFKGGWVEQADEIMAGILELPYEHGLNIPGMENVNQFTEDLYHALRTNVGGFSKKVKQMSKQLYKDVVFGKKGEKDTPTGEATKKIIDGSPDLSMYRHIQAKTQETGLDGIGSETVVQSKITDNIEGNSKILGDTKANLLTTAATMLELENQKKNATSTREMVGVLFDTWKTYMTTDFTMQTAEQDFLATIANQLALTNMRLSREAQAAYEDSMQEAQANLAEMEDEVATVLTDNEIDKKTAESGLAYQDLLDDTAEHLLPDWTEGGF